MRPSFLPLFVLALPFVEIAGFIVVGKAIGVLATLGLVVATSLLGVVLLRRQGMGLLRRLQSEGRSGVVPGRELVHGAMIAVAGFLLLLPGFFTDIVGLLFFIPAVRDLAWRWLGARMVVTTSTGFRTGTSGSGTQGRGAPVVDLDAEDFRREPDPKSPWSGSDPRIGN